MKKLPSGVIRTCPVRLAFTKTLVAPEKNEKSGKDRWRCSATFPAGASLAPLVDECKAAAIAEFGEKALELVAAEKIRWPIKDQSKCTNAELELYPGFSAEPGLKYCDVSTTIRPDFRDRFAKPCDPSVFYWGVWALLTVHVYADEYTDDKTKTTNRYVAIGLNNLQFLVDDEKLGGGAHVTNADDEFEPIDASLSPGAAFGSASSPAVGAAAPGKPVFDFG